jgi:hypothetical protein
VPQPDRVAWLDLVNLVDPHRYARANLEGEIGPDFDDPLDFEPYM